jgi:hypothetical protein
MEGRKKRASGFKTLTTGRHSILASAPAICSSSNKALLRAHPCGGGATRMGLAPAGRSAKRQHSAVFPNTLLILQIPIQRTFPNVERGTNLLHRHPPVGVELFGEHHFLRIA